MMRKDYETVERVSRQIAREEAIRIAGGGVDSKRLDEINERLAAIEKKLAAVDKALGK